jgi:hypothetical protein
LGKAEQTKESHMRSTFHISGEYVPLSSPTSCGAAPNPTSYRLDICFNGIPGVVVLGMDQGDGSDLQVRALLKASEARAIASALLSAATEAKQPSA